MDVFQLNIFASVGNEFVMNALHFESSVSSSTTPDLDALALITAWQTSVQTDWLACLSSDYTLGGYQAKRINNGGGPTYPQIGTALVGTMTGTSVVSGAGALITSPYHQTSGTKPQWRTGRIFVPGIPAGMVVKNLIQGPLTAALSQVCVDLASPLGSSPNFTYGVWSRTTSQWYSVNSPDVSPNIGTLRRRYRPRLA